MGLKALARRFGLDIRRAEQRKNIYIGKPAWEYQAASVLAHYRQGDVVLDIGCGHAPTPISTILTDFFPDALLHRARPVVEDRPLVICSAENMPFRDGAFDLSICTHVLEHLSDPGLAADEFARVSAKGYLETPSYGKDVLIGTGRQHLWQVVNSDGKLHFFPYTARQHAANFQSPFMDIWVNEEFHPLQPYFWERQDLFNATQFWHGRPQIVLHGEVEAHHAQEWTPVADGQMPAWQPALTDSEIAVLNDRLVSPDKASLMRYANGEFVDPTGTIRYPVRGKRIYFELGK